MANVNEKVTLPRLTFKNGKTIKHGDIVISIPDGYHYTTDSSEMYEGKSYPILIVPADYSFSDNPDDASFSIAFEPYMTMSRDGKGIDIRPETAVGMERFLCMQWGQVFNSEVTWIDAGVRNGFGAFYQLYGDESTPSHRFMLGMIVTRYQMGAVHIHCNQKNTDLWNDPYGFIDKCCSFLERILVSGETVPSYVLTSPFDTLCPHYSQLKEKSGPIAPGVTMITNATGTEYEFIPLSSFSERYDLPDDENALYMRIIDKDTVTHDLTDKASEMQRLFHVNAAVFDEKHDRECEIEQGYLHRAYMMSALRSFAWTLAEYCDINAFKPDDVTVKKLKEIVAFCAEKEWLNYRGRSHCRGLCDCADLHVFYIPDAVSQADRKKLLPSDEEIRDTNEKKAKLPYYNPILDEVNSLDALRNDLRYIYPAVKALWTDLKANRNYNKPLTGNEADIVYAWCSLAKAAKEPFYVEDGPMYCDFTQMKTEEESAAEREAQRIRWEAEREENAERNKEEWLTNYGYAVEKNPDIQFDGKLFVFSGVDSDEIVDAVLKKGGQERSKISGITNYLVVDPRYCGESKTYNAIEQQKKGKPVKIILLEDLRAALEGKTSAAKPVSESLSKMRTTTSSTADTFRKTIMSDLSNEEDTIEDKYVIFEGELLEYKGSEKDIILPDGITKIGACLFQSSALRSIVIPDSVIEIGGYAFNNCKELKQIDLPNGIEKIEEGAFSGCTELIHIALPNSLKEMGENAFSGCRKLESIDFPEGLSEIGSHAFYESGIKEIQIPKSCKVIHKWAFDSCLELMSVILHDSIDNIENWAFSDCPKLKEVHIPSGVKVEKWAFDSTCAIHTDGDISADAESADENNASGFPQGTRVYAGEDLEIVDGVVIEYSGDETDIILPEGITKIGKNAFASSHIRSVVIPEGVTEIEESAFSSCEKLMHVSLPASLKRIGKYAFLSYCGNEMKEINLPEGLSVIGESAFSHASFRSVVIPEGVIEIGERAFEECEELTYVSLPSSLKTIGANAFCECTQLKKVDFSEGLSEIEDSAFQECGLEEVRIPSSCTIIAEWSFQNCPELSRVILHDKVQLIEDFAFESCPKLTTVLIPKETIVSENAFDDEVIIERFETVSAEKESGLNNAYADFPEFLIASTGILIKYLGKNKPNLELPKGLTGIGARALKSHYELESITIPEGVTHIDNRACANCSNLKEISLPSTLQSVGNGAFERTGIETISLPASLVYLGENAFWYCKNLKRVVFCGSIDRIRFGTFMDCESLNTIIIPDGTKTIESHAFVYSDSNQPRDIFIPASMTEIVLNRDDVNNTVFHVQQGSKAEQYCITYGIKHDKLSYKEFIGQQDTDQLRSEAETEEKNDPAAESEKSAGISDSKYASGESETCASRAEEQRIEQTYAEAKQLMQAENYVAAKDKFLEIAEYHDSETLAKQCEEKEQIRRSELAYQQLIGKKLTAKTVGDWIALENQFIQMNDYKESQTQAKLCAEKAAEVQRQIEEERQKELARRAKEERRKALETEKKEQEAIIEQNRGLGALFGEKAKKRKAAQARIEEINRELEKL